jgi:tetratricopeptide (TPR) repeat protein
VSDWPKYYRTLGIPPTATYREIHAAYVKWSKFISRPDNVPAEQRARAKEIKGRLDEAYAVLIDPWRRRIYDAVWRQQQSLDMVSLPKDIYSPALALTIPPVRQSRLPGIFFATGVVIMLILGVSGLVVESRDKSTYPVTLGWSAAPTDVPAITLPPSVEDQAALAQAEKLYQEGKAAFDKGEWRASIAPFDKALLLNPRHALAYNYRGAAYRHLGSSSNSLEIFLKNNDAAIRDFSRAIVADPTWWGAYNNRGVSYDKRAELEPLRDNRRKWVALALADYTRALELDGAQGWPYCNRSIAYAESRGCDRALTDAFKCSTQDRFMIVSRAYRCAGRYTEALENAQIGLSVEPENPNSYWERGLVYLGKGEYDKAISDFETADKKWQGSTSPGVLLYNRAAAEYRLGSFDLAKYHIAQGKDHTYTDWGEPYYYLGMIYLREDNVQRATEMLQWAERTLDEGDLLEATHEQLRQLELNSQK